MMETTTTSSNLRERFLSFAPAWAGYPVVALFLALGLLLFPQQLHCQVAPSAYADRHGLWTGVEYSTFQPDWGAYRMEGVGIYADLNLKYRVAAEGEVRFLRWNSYFGENESSYLLGPKVRLADWGRFHAYAKVLFGVGTINFPNDFGSGTYFAVAPGGGVDYRLGRRFAVRAEYEYQIWPTAPGIPGLPDNGMTPNGLNIGFAYKLLNR